MREPDPFDLERFVVAQAPVYRQVTAELARGRKESHWMWFIFPQMRGLGRSAMAEYYGIGSLDEARAYLAYPLLGARLRECVGLVNRVEGRPARAIFGSPDDMKFGSSLTLFARTGGGEAVFTEALAKYFGGVEDAATMALLAPGGGPDPAQKSDAARK
ncbi:MAG TPA: DUF1810 domain-containing protein [Bauldia sp.]|nr:DUF1810 domain-containing protein [Bauldia sp.]